MNSSIWKCPSSISLHLFKDMLWKTCLADSHGPFPQGDTPSNSFLKPANAHTSLIWISAWNHPHQSHSYTGGRNNTYCQYCNALCKCLSIIGAILGNDDKMQELQLVPRWGCQQHRSNVGWGAACMWSNAASVVLSSPQCCWKSHLHILFLSLC